MILNDTEIRRLCLAEAYHKGDPMVEPFSEPVSGNGVVSYGLTSAGYDIRLADEILVFRGLYEEIDPKRFGDPEYRKRMLSPLTVMPISEEIKVSRWVTLPPHSYVLGRSYEYFRVPRHLKARCTGKSTYARAGIVVNTTPLEPGWRGHLTLEIGNITPCPARLWVMEGIAQIEFEVLTSEPEVSYADKRGQYQGQVGVTPAKVKGSYDGEAKHGS